MSNLLHSLDNIALAIQQQTQAIERQTQLSERIALALEALNNSAAQLSDHVVPPPNAIVGSDYVAKRLGCTTTWVAQMVRKGMIPKTCIVAGTGKGRFWKFHRQQIEQWLAQKD
jgi:Helix-turn-helix domain